MRHKKEATRNSRQCKKLQFVLKLSAFSFYDCVKSLPPFTHRRVNNSLVKIVPSLHDSLTKIFNITDVCFAHHFLHVPPYLIIDGIHIWAVRGPQCRIYKVRSFIRQKCNRFSSSVRWSTILLENVKFREFSNFRYTMSSMRKTYL